MKTILDKLFQHQVLSKNEAKQLLIDMTNGMFNPSQLAAILTSYNIRTITLNELIGFREALRELSIKINQFKLFMINFYF